MKHVLPLLFLFLADFMEATVLALPVTLLVLFLWYIKTLRTSIFIFAFFAGFFLDTLLVGEIGLRSIFFVMFIFLVFLYQRKFEIKTIPFVFFASFFGSVLYSFIFLHGPIIFAALIVSFLAVVFFLLLSSFWGGARDDSRISL